VTLVQIVVLALIQGLTEFLPVSSSAHLILGSVVFGWPDQGLVFDVATHLGTLLAALVYFRRDWLDMTEAWLHAPRTAEDRQHRKMAVLLALASLPALLIGGLAPDFVEKYLRDVTVLAWTTIGFGLLLGLADRVSPKTRDVESVTLRDALLIGLGQACALVPGVSRSGITITVGRFVGLTPDAAARFSFLMAVPIIAAAGASVSTGSPPARPALTGCNSPWRCCCRSSPAGFALRDSWPSSSASACFRSWFTGCCWGSLCSGSCTDLNWCARIFMMHYNGA
jgi:undecaprenyl-diphosphatase